MRLYELTYLILPEISEKDLEKIQNELRTFIEQKGGFLEKEEKPVRKKMSPQINEISSAFLGSCDFQLNQEEVKNLERELREKKEIFNFILLNRKEQKTTAKKKRLAPQKIRKTEKKVELSKIEKKLNEILGE